MTLKALCRHVLARNPLKRAVEQGSMGHLKCVGKILLGDGEAMVLTGHHHGLVAEVLHRVSGAVMATLHLLSARPTGQRQNLVPKANPEQWDLAIHHLTRKSDRVLAGLGIPRPIGKEHAVGRMGHDLVNRRLGGHHSHSATEIHENAQDVALH